MTKKESIKKNKAKKRFEQVCADYAINSESDYREIVKTLVEKASELQGKIDTEMEEIKTVLYDKFVEVYGSDFSNSLWMSLVNMNNKRGYATEKAVDKMKDKIENDLFAANTLNLFFGNDFGESFENGNEVVKFPDYCKFNEDDYSTDGEADNVLKEATEKRSYVGRTLMVEYKRIAKAVAYIILENTGEEIKSGDFKMIVDFVHYAGDVTTESEEESPRDKAETFTSKVANAIRVANLLGQNVLKDYFSRQHLTFNEN